MKVAVNKIFFINTVYSRTKGMDHMSEEQNKKLEDAKKTVEEMLKDPEKKNILKNIVDSIAKDAAELSEAFNKTDFAIKDFMKSKTAWIVIAIIGMGGFSGWYFANQQTVIASLPPAIAPIEEVQKDWKDTVQPPIRTSIEEPKDIPAQELPSPPQLDTDDPVPEEYKEEVNQRALWCRRVLRRFDSYWIDLAGGQVRDEILEREARICKKYLNKIGASYLYSK
jgi:hypothetical protein